MRPATIASLEVDGLKPARLLVVALLTFVLIVSASVSAGSRPGGAGGGKNSSYAYMPPPAAGFGATVATAAQDPSAGRGSAGLRPAHAAADSTGARQRGLRPRSTGRAVRPAHAGGGPEPGRRHASRPRRCERRAHRQQRWPATRKLELTRRPAPRVLRTPKSRQLLRHRLRTGWPRQRSSNLPRRRLRQ